VIEEWSPMKNQYKDLEYNLKSRNIDFKYCESRSQVIDLLEELTKSYKSIGIGNSQTLKAIGASQHLMDLDKTVYDKTYGHDKTEIRKLKKLALTADCYITSSNAIAMTGELVNVDHSGNRVAAMTYGPDKVIVIVTTNKVVENEKSAITRALKTATPLNAKRANIKSPCSQGNPCSQCSQDVRVCNYLSIIRGQHEKDRMMLVLLNDELGF